MMRLDPYDSGWKQMMDTYQTGDELPNSVKRGNCFN
jgi:hypothetical protein